MTWQTNWHIDDETLRRYVDRTDSVADGASVEQHVLVCAPCRTRVNGAGTRVDLDAVWERTRDAVELPRRTLFERFMATSGLPPHAARIVAVAGAFRGVCLFGVFAILAFASLAAYVGNDHGLLFFLLVAPVTPCLLVALAYDWRWDPALEPEIVTPYPLLRLVLLRTVAVLALALPVVLLLGLVVPGPAPFVWLLPAVGFVGLVLAGSTWTSPLNAALAASGGWLLAVWALVSHAVAPASFLQPGVQVAFLVLAAASLSVFLVRGEHLNRIHPRG